MSSVRRVFFAILAIVMIFGFAFPAFALQYSPGVIFGQYAKYGNFVGAGPGEESINNTSYIKQEITKISGTEVTLLTTGQFKDGTPTAGNGSIQVWDVSAGTLNGIPSVQGPIIAANLNQGDPIPPPNTYIVNQSETRSYLGIGRTVNILTSAVFTQDYNTTVTYVYDKASGMLLESSSQTVAQGQPEPITSTYSYSITETNIFGQPTTTFTPTPANSASASPSPTVPEFPSQILITVLLGTISVISIFTVFLRRTRKSHS